PHFVAALRRAAPTLAGRARCRCIYCTGRSERLQRYAGSTCHRILDNGLWMLWPLLFQPAARGASRSVPAPCGGSIHSRAPSRVHPIAWTFLLLFESPTIIAVVE